MSEFISKIGAILPCPGTSFRLNLQTKVATGIVPVSRKRVNVISLTRSLTVMLRTNLRMLLHCSDGAEHMLRRRASLGGGIFVATMMQPAYAHLQLTASNYRKHGLYVG